MWFNIIPSFAIVVGALALPPVLIAGLHKLAYDNIYQRDVQFSQQRFMFLRDERISGSPWKMVGLEGIPDEEPQQ